MAHTKASTDLAEKQTTADSALVEMSVFPISHLKTGPWTNRHPPNLLDISGEQRADKSRPDNSHAVVNHLAGTFSHLISRDVG